MNSHEQSGISRHSLLIGSGVFLLILISSILLWLNFKSSSELQGRYSARGQIQLSSGQVIEAAHTIQFRNGDFYAVTRQGAALLETSGSIEYGFLGHYRLHIDEGTVTGLTGETDTELAFNLMYGRHKGSTINLIPLRSCLYGLETRQVYCLLKQSRGF